MSVQLSTVMLAHFFRSQNSATRQSDGKFVISTGAQRSGEIPLLIERKGIPPIVTPSAFLRRNDTFFAIFDYFDSPCILFFIIILFSHRVEY